MVLFLCVGLGCTNDVRSVDPSEVELELGTGRSTFRSLSDGDPLELETGFQGGRHAFVGVFVTGFFPNETVLSYEAYLMSTGEIVAARSIVLTEANTEVSGDGWTRIGDRLVFLHFDPTMNEESRATLRAVLALPGGGQKTASVPCMLVPGE
jgi:hypothetical protein